MKVWTSSLFAFSSWEIPLPKGEEATHEERQKRRAEKKKKKC